MDAVTAELITALKRVFPPNPAKHGRFLGVDENGNKEVETLDAEPVTDALLLEHLNAPHGPLGRTRRTYAIGFLPGNEEGTTVGMLDLDGQDYPTPDGLLNAARAVIAACEKYNLTPYLERSTRGNGWHVFVFSDAPISHAKMRQALRALRRVAGIVPSTETYPAGESHRSTWFGTPYAGALHHPQRLGRTYLETTDGRAIPLDELEDTVDFSPATTLLDLAAEEEARQPTYGNGAPADLPPGAVEDLIACALEMNGVKNRHGHIAALLNCGRRAGRMKDMAEQLKRADVFAALVKDNSRTLAAWGDEVDDWAAWIDEHPSAPGRGLQFLRDSGFNLPASLQTVTEPPATPLEGEVFPGEEPQGADFWTITGPDGLPTRLVLPSPYRADALGGIEVPGEVVEDANGKKKQRPPRLVAPRPLAVVAAGEDSDTHEGVAVVRFKTGNAVTRERRVPLAALADGRELVKALAPFDAPVLASRAKWVTEYLDAFRTANRHVLPYDTFTARLGLRTGGIVGPGYGIGSVPRYAGEFGSRFRTGGDADAYPRALREILSWGAGAWPLWLDLGLAALGPLLSLVKPTRNPVVWHHGPSNAGKTTAARFAGGLHLYPRGEPFTLQGARQTTPKGTLQTLEQMGGFPVLIDEAHEADLKALEGVVYQFANGQSYTRGGRDGTPRQTPTLHGVAFLAGEAPPQLRNIGSRNRALMLDVRHFPPLGKLDAPERAELLEAAWEAGAGTLGPRVLESIWNDRDNFLAAVKASEARQRATVAAGEGREWLRALVAAEIALAYLIETAGITGEPPAAVAPALAALQAARDAFSPAGAAMEALVGLIATHDPGVVVDGKDRYEDDSVRRAYGSTFARLSDKPGEGWLICTTHKLVLETLEPWGGRQAVHAFGTTWVEKGWVKPGPRFTTIQRRFDGPNLPCLVLTPEALERGGEDE